MLPNRFKYPHRQRPHSAEGDQASSPIEKCGKFYGKSKNFVRQLDHLQQNGYAKQQEFKPTGLSDETVRCFLHSQGYRYCHSHKKGLLTTEDLKRRLKYATEISKRPDSKELWLNRISFYIDAAGFQHKYNPFDEVKSIKTMAWTRDEGLESNCTAKGSHVGSGGKVLHFMGAISYTQGVILCEQYEGRINGQIFADFIRDHFARTFKKSVNPTGKLILQDGDPS